MMGFFDKQSSSKFCSNLAKLEKLSIEIEYTYWWEMHAHINQYS